MSGLDQTLLNRLRQLLLKCDEFHSPRLLYAVMGTAPLAPWQTGLPSADAVSTRVDLTIHYLSDKRHINGESALVLLLQVLAERYAEQDERHKALLGLANELRNGKKSKRRDSASTLPPSPGTPTGQKLDSQGRNRLLDILCNRLSSAELRELVFRVLPANAYDNLPGNTHTERSISFLEEVARREKEFLLLTELMKMRPDVELPL